MRAGDEKHRAGRVIGRIATECSSTMYLRSHKEWKVVGRQRRERERGRERADNQKCSWKWWSRALLSLLWPQHMPCNSQILRRGLLKKGAAVYRVPRLRGLIPSVAKIIVAPRMDAHFALDAALRASPHRIMICRCTSWPASHLVLSEK